MTCDDSIYIQRGVFNWSHLHNLSNGKYAYRSVDSRRNQKEERRESRINYTRRRQRLGHGSVVP